MRHIFHVPRYYHYWGFLLSVFPDTFYNFWKKRALYYRKFEHKFQKVEIIFIIHDSAGLFFINSVANTKKFIISFFQLKRLA